MIFRWEQTIPANTPRSAPLEWKMRITTGTITNVWIFFPWGCANLAGIQIWYEGTQVWPVTANEWMRGNDILYHFEDPYRIETEPTFLLIKGYNEDDTYDHTPWVMVQVIREALPERLKRFFEILTRGL